MRIQIEPHAGLRAAPRSLYRGKRRIDIIEIVDQWYGPGYRYVKVRGHDNSVYILRFDEVCDRWDLIMFSAERARVSRLIPFHFSARYRDRADELTREAEEAFQMAEPLPD